MQHTAVCWAGAHHRGGAMPASRAAGTQQASGRLHVCARQPPEGTADMRHVGRACEDHGRHLLQALQCLDRSGLTI